MTPVHIHLLLNHAPVIGIFVGIFVLVVGMVRRSDEIKRLSIWLFVLCALISIPVYVSGNNSEEAAEKLPGISEEILEQHEETAEISFVAVIGFGILCLAGLFFFRRSSAFPQWFTTMLVILSLVVSVLFAYTANLGGQIRHSEIRSEATEVD
jgi:uncharacterized membrane protein